MLKPKFNHHRYKNNHDKMYPKFDKEKNTAELEKNNKDQNNSSCCTQHSKKNIIFQEFLCHLPMSILALCISLLCLTFFDNIIIHIFSHQIKKTIYMNFFHIAHYIHILCASFGSFYSSCNIHSASYKKIFILIIFSFLNSLIFCSLADIILPSIGGLLLDNSIQIHLCFLHKEDIINAIVFSLFGIFAAFCLQNGEKEYGYKIAKKVHLGHVWFGCIASLLYILSELNIDIINSISILFLILFFSVIIPCVFADICLPYLFTTKNNSKNEYQNKKINYHN